MNLPKTRLFRHDQVTIPRPFAFDVDANDWLWEGNGKGHLGGHRLGTGEFRRIQIPELGERFVFSAFSWGDWLVLELGYGAEYLVYQPETGRCLRRHVPGENPITWFGSKTLNRKLLICERAHGKALILDAPEAEPRIVQCPYDGDFGSVWEVSDGLLYTFMADPARVVRFDPVKEAFVDERPLPWPDSGPAGRGLEHDGVIYVPDTAGGRLLPMELRTQKWLDPIPVPGHGTVFGYIGPAFKFEGKGYFNLSTYTHRSRLDRKTGQVIVPEGKLTVDGKPLRFMERMLVFDPATREFDYLLAPEQPDGMTPLLCYQWTDGRRFAVTGIVFPSDYDGEGGGHSGPW